MSIPLETDGSAGDVILHIANQNRAVSALIFQVYAAAPAVSERVRDGSRALHTMLVNRAQELTHEYGIPYWDALVGVAMRESSVSEHLIRAAVFHPTPDASSSLKILTKDLTASRLESLKGECGPDQAVGLCSRVELSGAAEHAHIPMIDFRCPPTDANLDSVRLALKSIGQTRGAILDSGRSYHYYGFELIAERDWMVFFARCLLLAPLVDSRYIAHRMLDGFAVLRVFANVRKPNTPQTVALL